MSGQMASAADGAPQHPFHPAVWPDPYPAYRWLAEHEPLHVDRFSGMVFATRHTDCDALLRNRSASSARAQQQRRRGQPLPTSMLTTDPPEHARLRAPAMQLLGPAAVGSLAPRMCTAVSALLTSAAEHDVLDAVSEVGGPFATAVLAGLLELPPSEWSRFSRLAQQASVHLDPMATPAQVAQGGGATAELADLLRTHANSLGVDCPLQRFWHSRRLDEPERVATLMLIVIGGYEPLATLAVTGLSFLARHTDLVSPIEARETAATSFVHEVLRLESPIPFAARQLVEDVRLPSGHLPAGSNVLALLGSANRDPEVFPDADELRLDRASNPHLAFGAGVHYCPGAPLVTATAAHLFRDVASRFPLLACAEPAARPRWRSSIVPRGLSSLPLRLDATPAG